jgi:diphosphomevalonate decarboxylase
MSEVSWKSPSNIAIVKYWGKKQIQIPCNASISMTLQKAYTETSLKYVPGNGKLSKFFFEGQENPAFASRIEKYLASIQAELPALQQFDLEIHSENSFPHSSGIASSASAFSALALCLCSMQAEADGDSKMDAAFYQKAGRLARLGSGSASRSLLGPWMQWGISDHISGSSDDYAQVIETHEVFKNFCDTILIVDEGQKSVSSSAGHGLMNGNPYSEARYKKANQHVADLDGILKAGRVDEFLELAEVEALELHALMMASTPPFILMKPQTLLIIQHIQKWRKEDEIPVSFTLDAGPNVHILYPAEEREYMEMKIRMELSAYYKKVLWDEAGPGAERIG